MGSGAITQSYKKKKKKKNLIWSSKKKTANTYRRTEAGVESDGHCEIVYGEEEDGSEKGKLCLCVVVKLNQRIEDWVLSASHSLIKARDNHAGISLK